MGLSSEGSSPRRLLEGEAVGQDGHSCQSLIERRKSPLRGWTCRISTPLPAPRRCRNQFRIGRSPRVWTPAQTQKSISVPRWMSTTTSQYPPQHLTSNRSDGSMVRLGARRTHTAEGSCATCGRRGHTAEGGCATCGRRIHSRGRLCYMPAGPTQPRAAVLHAAGPTQPRAAVLHAARPTQPRAAVLHAAARGVARAEL